MKIKKPHNFILSKKFPDRYFDLDTYEEFPYEEIDQHPHWYKEAYDNNVNKIYWEDCYGTWIKYEYDTNGNKIYAENNVGNWAKWKYDNNEKKTYWENWYGDWQKWIYDNNGNLMYYENNDGLIVDTRI